MTRDVAQLTEELEHIAPEAHVRKFLGLPAADCSDATTCGCPERARRAEDTLPNSHINLRLHNAKRPNHEYELSGAWIGNVEDEGSDEMGMYLDVRIRPSKFYKHSSRIVKVRGS